MGEEGPQVGRIDAQEVDMSDQSASVVPQEIDQPMRRRDIGAHRVRRAAAVVLEMIGPAGSEPACRMFV
jgi:hypothetical protein